ncbi:hypothetical protein ABK040_004910 [Willaertia magna]
MNNNHTSVNSSNNRSSTSASNNGFRFNANETSVSNNRNSQTSSFNNTHRNQRTSSTSTGTTRNNQTTYGASNNNRRNNQTSDSNNPNVYNSFVNSLNNRSSTSASNNRFMVNQTTSSTNQAIDTSFNRNSFSYTSGMPMSRRQHWKNTLPLYNHIRRTKYPSRSRTDASFNNSFNYNSGSSNINKLKRSIGDSSNTNQLKRTKYPSRSRIDTSLNNSSNYNSGSSNTNQSVKRVKKSFEFYEAPQPDINTQNNLILNGDVTTVDYIFKPSPFGHNNFSEYFKGILSKEVPQKQQINVNDLTTYREKPKRPYYKRPVYQLPTDLLEGNATYSKSKDLHNYYNDVNKILRRYLDRTINGFFKQKNFDFLYDVFNQLYRSQPKFVKSFPQKAHKLFKLLRIRNFRVVCDSETPDTFFVAAINYQYPLDNLATGLMINLFRSNNNKPLVEKTRNYLYFRLLNCLIFRNRFITDLSKTYEDFVNTLKENIKTQGFQDFKFVLPDILGSYIVTKSFNLRKRIQTEYMEKSEFLEFTKNILCINLYGNLPVLMSMVNSKKKESNIRFSVDYSYDLEYGIIEVLVFDKKKLYDCNELYQLLKINMTFNPNLVNEDKGEYNEEPRSSKLFLVCWTCAELLVRYNNLVTNFKDYVYTHFLLYYLYSREYYDKYYEFFKSIVQDQFSRLVNCEAFYDINICFQ